MLSIFEQKDFEDQPERKLRLDRLQNALGATAMKGPAPRPAVAVEEAPAQRQATPEPVSLDRRPLAPPPPSVPEPPPAERADAAEGIELDQFADQFARGFRQVLASAVRDLQAPVADERRKMDTALDLLNRTAKDLESFRSELAEATRRIDSIAKSMHELGGRTEKLEDSVNIAGAAAHAMQDAQQAIEKRLELQAGILRGLNTTVQGREDRLDKLLSTFQTLQGPPNDRPLRRGLPENL